MARPITFSRRLLLGPALMLATTGMLALPATAQDTAGVPQTTGPGTVVKGIAPVARDLLKVRFPRPQAFHLSNGLAVYVLEDHRLPAVHMSLIVRAGEVYEPKPAVAGMTAAMLTEGTQSRDFQELARQTEDIGANLTADAGLDTATISASGLSETTDQLIALLSEAALHPTFPQDRLDRVKFLEAAQVAQRQSSPTAVASDLSSLVFYGGTPYARPSPTAAQIKDVTRDDLVTFHDRYYRPNGAILGISGDVSAGSLKSKLEAAFGSWQPGPVTVELPSSNLQPRDATRVYLVDRPGSTQTVLEFGNLAVRQNDPDYIPLVVANRILGGGSSGRLFQNIREQKGYTYGAYSSIGASPWPTVWSASASVRTPVTTPAAQEFFKEFARLQQEPVSEAELDRAKRSIIGSFALTLESPANVLARTLEVVENGLPASYWDTYPARVQAVTAADVQRVARKYLGAGRLQVIAVGERAQIEAGLKQFGPIDIVDANDLKP